jgi:glutamine synthetase
MIDMATKQIIPAVIKYTTVLADSINSVKGAGGYNVSVQESLLEKASGLLSQAYDALAELETVTKKIPSIPEGKERAEYCQQQVIPVMEKLRKPVDELEMIVDKEMWPMPSYGDLIFEL